MRTTIMAVMLMAALLSGCDNTVDTVANAVIEGTHNAPVIAVEEEKPEAATLPMEDPVEALGALTLPYESCNPYHDPALFAKCGEPWPGSVPLLKENDTESTYAGRKQLMEIREQASTMPVRNVSDQYDDYFKKYTKEYLPFYEYTLVKAQCYQESRLKYDAVSPVGAQGLCQFMPGTWGDVAKPLNISPEQNAFNPELSVMAACYYDARIRNTWKSPRPDHDRFNLVFASYNAGAGHLINAQKACGGPNLYDDIVVCLPEITGHNSVETMQYVERIRRIESVLNIMQ